MEQLELDTIGDLTKYTDADLLACKNFGLTSLKEVNQKLTSYGLTLRQVEESQ